MNVSLSLSSILSGGSLGSLSLESGAVGVVPVQLAWSHTEPHVGIRVEDVEPSEEV